MTDTESGLVQAVRELSAETRNLHTLLKTDYPKRGEVANEYVSKFQQQRVIIRLLLGAVLLTAMTFLGTIGSFSICLVGEDNPAFCTVVPGFDDRADRRDELDQRNERQDKEIARLLKKLDLNPTKPLPKPDEEG